MSRALCLVALFLFVPAMVFAQAPSKPPVNVSGVDKYIRVGSPVWGVRMSVPTTTRPVRNNQSGATTIGDLRLFAFDSIVSMSCVAQAGFCFSQTSSVTLSTGNQFGHIFDRATALGQTAGTSGVGPCWVVEPGIPYSFTLFRDLFQGPQASTVAARDGVCIGTTSNATEFWPCNADADCSTGTCSRVTLNGRAAKARQRGAFLISIAPVATTCAVWQEY